MKKLGILLVLFIIFASSQKSFAQYSIPSYNVRVDGRAYFEDELGSRGKRSVSITEVCVGSLRSADTSEQRLSTIYVYTLDHSIILGPYYISCGETLIIPIDEGEWGVYVQTNLEVSMDIYFIDE